jgi:hypothetical protein
VLDSRDMIESETVKLDAIISQLDSPDHQTLILLDACRNNPLPQSVRGSDTGDGLAQVTRMVNTYVAFSTQPGNVSVDGTGSNSPFAKALVDNLDLAGESVSNVMVKVRRSVLEATNNLQQPFEQSTLTDYFYFNPAMQTRVTFKLPGLTPSGPDGPPADLPRPKQPDEEIPVIVASLPTGQDRSVPMVEPPSFEMIDITPAEPPAAGTPPAPVPEQPQSQVAELQPTIAEPPAEPQVAAPVPDTAEQPPSDLPDNLEMAIQQQLKDIGCYTSTVDGAWGNGSRAALSDFFKAKGEPVVTDPTAEVYHRLKGESGRVCEVKVATPQPVKQQPAPVKQQPAPVKQQPAPAAAQPPATSKPNFNGGGIGVFR